MDRLSFNCEQQNIINHIKGSIRVLAPVGTGKTSVLSARVANAVSQGFAPERILCLTFTNRAAREMGDRLAKFQPEVYRKLAIKTFHGLCAHMLQVEAQTIGLPTDFAVYDDNDCFEILKNLSKFDEDQEVWNLLNQIADCKSKASQEQLTIDLVLDSLFGALDYRDRQIALKYQKVLGDRHALDFADLIFYTRSMLHCSPTASQRWRDRFDFAQVDEVQDTHLGEYEIVRALAVRSGNLALIGDLDQTIYAWRGSEPSTVLDCFDQEFHPITYSLSLNYRSTKILLGTASNFANSFDQRHTSINPAPSCDVGEDILTHIASDWNQEALWIAQQIQTLAAGHGAEFQFNRLAVLARTHRKARHVAATLTEVGIPCITVDQYQFFMRQEIKDALSYLRFITNPFDTGAFKRLILSPKRGISLDKLRAIYSEGLSCSFRLTDLAAPQPFTHDDPLGNIIEAYTNGTIVVLDVETTGVSVVDDIVEIAAVKLVNGQLQEAPFHAYISDASDVGESQHVHGYSNEFLKEHGEPARTVLENFYDFVGDALLIGHNVGFDIKMVTAHAQRAGIQVPTWQWADTWNLAHRFIATESYSLENLAKKLKLTSSPNHHAMDDVRTTTELLAYLMPFVENQSSDRVALYSKHGEDFAPLAEEISNWKQLSQQLRPAKLLKHILQSSGLARHYASDQSRIQNLAQLMKIFQEKDDSSLHPDTALRGLLEFTALAKNLDHISEQNNQVVVITAHQAKGLEFDHVFIAGMTEGEFPSYHSVQDGNIEEEKRLFYVALTRAKKRLYLSGCSKNRWGNPKLPSQFLQYL
ncbi:3'-5' exonuclease [Leptolyngbya sp. FACHB-711]|uniref:3'-5' exonuclease n=1 Tax=Leptolyngbya sp. FACHB-711 TaxID=2692813 RepID=UPI00168645F1|nr:3'-5' exonuclease [Leptolyngbya sp. FACHB-711]MBD2028236.1 UvrD-helicase domain-containing protein [Leptolyngbya sp. FACHB-711]